MLVRIRHLLKHDDIGIEMPQELREFLTEPLFLSFEIGITVQHIEVE